MTRSVTLTFLVLLAAGSACSENLAPNPSFEIVGAGWRPVQTAERGQRPLWSESIARTGSHALCIVGNWPTGYGEWRIRQNPKLQPGKEYDVGVWARQELVRERAPYIEIYSFNKQKRPERILRHNGLKGTVNWYPIRARFTVPEDSVSCRVALGLSDGMGKVWFDDVYLELANGGGRSFATMSWRASWITGSKIRGRNVTFFRKSFGLNFIPREAIARVTADKEYVLYLNGRRCAQDANWESVEVVDLKPWLVEGKNTLTAQVRCMKGIPAFLMEADIAAPDGQKVTIASDATWQSAHRKEGPLTSVQVLGAPPRAPWGKLTYFLPHTPPEVIRITAIEMPRVVQPGRTFDLTLALKPDQPLKQKQYRFILKMRSADVELLDKEVTVSPSALPPGVATRALRVRVPVSRYCPAGSVSLDVACPEVMLIFADAPKKTLLTIASVPRGRESISCVRCVNGKPTVFINDKPVPFLVYVKCFGFQKYMPGYMGRAGVHIHELDLWWQKCEPTENVIDLRQLTQRAIDTLEADPKAHFVIKYRLDVPYWWCKRFPSECFTSHNGHIGYTQSMASEVWRREAIRFMERTITRIRGYPFSQRVVAYHIGAGKGAEFQMWGSVLDYSPAMKASWCDWLTKKYGTDARLKDAWKVDSAAIRSAVLSSPTEAASASSTLIETNAKLRDFHQFLSDVNARSIAALVRGLRSFIGQDKIVGMYYGYLFEHAQRSLREGTLGINKVIDIPDIQYHSAPETYYSRRVGETGGFMSPVDSMILRGKSFLLEADIRTHLWDSHAGYGRTRNTYETVQVLRRELLMALTKGVGVRWMDLADYGHDAFGDPKVKDELRRMTAISTAVLDKTSMQPEVAIFVDAPSLVWFSYKTCGPFLQQMLSYQRSELQCMGAPYDQYLFKDIHRADLPDYKVYVFLSPLYLTESDCRRIRDVACRDGKTVVWFYAPGLFDGRGRSVENIARLTGFRLTERAEGNMSGQLVPSSHRIAHAAARVCRTFGKSMMAAPLFVPDDPKAVVLGRSKSGDPILAMKQIAGWKSIYAATNILPAALWREIARDAGVHIYTENGTPTYVGNGIVGVHTAKAGAQVITLPSTQARAQIEAPFGQKYSRDGSRIRFTTRAGETVIFIVR